MHVKIIVAGIVALLMGLAIVLALGWVLLGDDHCRTGIESLPASPNGEWEIVQSSTSCDSWEPPLRFALRRLGHSFDEKAVFVEAHQDAHVLVKWDDDRHVTLSIEERAKFMPPMRRNLLGIEVRYDTYPSDPDVARFSPTHRIINKTIPTKINFTEINDPASTVQCIIQYKSFDGDYIGKIYFRMHHIKIPAHNVVAEFGQIKRVPEHFSGHALIGTDRETFRTTTYVTSAAIGSSTPRNMSIARGINDPRDWSLIYDMALEDMEEIIRRLERGDLVIRAAFWLDNTEIHYEVDRPDDMGPIDNFRRCIARSKGPH